MEGPGGVGWSYLGSVCVLHKGEMTNGGLGFQVGNQEHTDDVTVSLWRITAGMERANSWPSS